MATLEMADKSPSFTVSCVRTIEGDRTSSATANVRSQNNFALAIFLLRIVPSVEIDVAAALETRLQGSCNTPIQPVSMRQTPGPVTARRVCPQREPSTSHDHEFIPVSRDRLRAQATEASSY